MNESILNGLLNLFAIFASIVKIDNEQAKKAVHSYLSSHFGVRDHQEHMELYTALRDMYDDPLVPVDKEFVIHNICRQMKVKLTAEEQFLLLVRFLEFACTNSQEFNAHLSLFRKVAEIFSISLNEFDEALAFLTGRPYATILLIDNHSTEEENHITREGMDGYIRVLYLRRFDKILFTYHGNGFVMMNDNAVTPGMFYSWQHSSFIKSPLFRPVYYSDLLSVFNKHEHKEEVFLSGRDIEFRFHNSVNGIHNFSFDAESGQLVAIMGGGKRRR